MQGAAIIHLDRITGVKEPGSLGRQELELLLVESPCLLAVIRGRGG